MKRFEKYLKALYLLLNGHKVYLFISSFIYLFIYLLFLGVGGGKRRKGDFRMRGAFIREDRDIYPSKYGNVGYLFTSPARTFHCFNKNT